jgi:hypothetical protein
MDINDQCVSLENAKKLKEAGIDSESIFHWILFSEWKIFHDGKMSQENYRDCIPAYTASELLMLLPYMITINNDESDPFNTFRLRIEKSFIVTGMDDKERLILSDVYIINYYCNTMTCSGIEAFIQRKLTQNIIDKNLADCLAKMLIHLFDNRLIKI